MHSTGGWADKQLNPLNQESDVMKMALLEGMSGIGMQHRLEGVGWRQELGCSSFPLKSAILDKIVILCQ